MPGVIFDQESYKVDLISESVGTILWCEISSAIPSDGPIFSEFYQMKFGNFVEVWLGHFWELKVYVSHGVKWFAPVKNQHF